ncbi:hypothetical protein MSAN_02085700 [Mycena sanguinolenta]|uniref:Uncharacterized protein n=1 Tax=Mycena sanguinolenta TaxID=230812 RepID=A0A8H6XH12_9AGAR|nr:hypothetical protein MSAN_02085700 [Mycena sanguinolenta]
MAISSRSPSVGMPGGSWTIEEEDAPQISNSSIHDLVAASPVLLPVLIQEPYTVNSEITVLDPANLSEEVRLLTSPSGSETRVRISPECMEVLLPEQRQDGSTAIPRHIRDSPEQRRSRYLHNIFPELADDLHAASRSPTTDPHSVPSVLDPDMEWEFPQHEFLSPAGTAGGYEDASFANGSQNQQSVPTLDRGLGLHFSSEDDPVEDQIAFAPNTSGAEGDVSSIYGASHPEMIPTLDLQSSADDPVREDTTSEPVADVTITDAGDDVGGDPGMLEEPRPSADDPGTSSVPGADTEGDASMSAMRGIGILVLEVPPFPGRGLSHFPDEGHDRQEDKPTSRNPPESQLDDDDHSTTYSSHSVPVTSISIPSTVRPIRSPSRSNAPSPSTGFGHDHLDDDPGSPRPHDIADGQVLQTRSRSATVSNGHDSENTSFPGATVTGGGNDIESRINVPSPSIGFGRSDDPPDSPRIANDRTSSAAVGDEHDSESLLSLFIRPAAASIASDQSEEAQEIDPEYAELEYHDENPPMTPLSVLGSGEISLPLSLDSSFVVPIPNEWEVVAHPRAPDSFFGGQPVFPAIDAPKALTSGVNEFAIASGWPLQDAEDRSTSGSTTESSQIHQSTDSKDGAANIAGDENDDGVQTSAPFVDGHSDDVLLHTSLELPPLDLHASSFTDAVLSSPVVPFIRSRATESFWQCRAFT